MSSSQANSRDSQRALDEAIKNFYSLVDSGKKVDREAFVQQYPELASELNEFFSNFIFFDDGPQREKSDQIQTTEKVVMLRDYRILELIGQGGMGSVYRAMHVPLQKQVALKTLRRERLNSDEAVVRFIREMRLLAKLEHANIVRAIDAGEHQGMHFFTMELVAGIDLSQLVKRLGPLPIPEASRIIRLAAEALQYAHDQKILHRDVKPSNLMITAKGSVKLLDLGLAHVVEMQLEDHITRMGQAVGTLAYMSPEQLANSQQCSNQSDVFSLGISLHELLSGKRPCHQMGGVPLVADVRSIRPDMDDQLCQLLDEMISPSPRDRPQSMAEVAERLSNFDKNADLVGLVAKYYCWNSPAPIIPTPPPVCDATEINSERKTWASDVARVPNPSGQKTIRPGIDRGRRRTIGTLFAGAAIISGIAIFYPPPPGDLGKAPDEPDVAPDEPGVATDEPGVAPPPRDGSLVIMSDADDEVVQWIIANGNMQVRAGQEGDQDFAIKNVEIGPNPLPPGSYQLLIHGPVDFVPIDFKITSSLDTPLLPTPSLKNNFQNPVIPPVGSFAKYHGDVLLETWSTKIPTTYTLTLEVVSVDDQTATQAKGTKWLKVEVSCTLETGMYKEEAFLKIDSDEWDVRRNLSIEEGYVKASGRLIEQWVDYRLPDADDDTLVVRFDPAKDLLKELLLSALPEERISIHDILVLYFGDNQFSAAHRYILMLRSQLSENRDRHVWVQPFQLSNAISECYVASSDAREEEPSVNDPSKVWWKITRTREHPFEIAEMWVKTPALKARCRDEGYGRSVITNSDKLRQTLDDLAARANLKIPSPHPFDLAKIPDVPSSVTVDGAITYGRLTEKIEFTASMLGTEPIEGKTFHWLELDVTSSLQGVKHWEMARLLVDASEYPGEPLKIERGWFAFDDEDTVLPLSRNNNLESIIDARLQLDADPHFKHMGVVDLMSMLFKTDFTPGSKLINLRKEIENIIKIRDFKLTKYPIKNYGELPCMLYMPLYDRKDSAQVTYKFYRCNKIPFAFARVELDVPKVVNVELEMVKHETLVKPFETSKLGSNENLTKLESATATRLVEEDPNWRIWTWMSAGKKYKAWAQFGGAIESKKNGPKDNILLWGREFGNECCVPLDLFVLADQHWIQRGRVWKTYNGEQRVLSGLDSNLVRFGTWDEGQKKVESDRLNVQESALEESDKKWVERHKKSKGKKINDWDDWDDFAPYVHVN